MATINSNIMSAKYLYGISETEVQQYSWETLASDVYFADKTNLEDKFKELNLEEKFEDLNSEITTIKKSVSDGKTLVATSITDMGVATENDATFEVMANNIGTIHNVGDSVTVVRNWSTSCGASGANHGLSENGVLEVPTLGFTYASINGFSSYCNWAGDVTTYLYGVQSNGSTVQIMSQTGTKSGTYDNKTTNYSAKINVSNYVALRLQGTSSVSGTTDGSRGAGMSCSSIVCSKT